MLAAAAAGTGDCSTAANACTLSTALGEVQPNGTIELVTPGGTAHYVGNWTINTANTTVTAPVTIQPAPGLASPPVLDGNKGASTGCTTAVCDGPVLTIPGGEYVTLTGITIANGDNTAGGFPVGGGLENAGTVTITGSTFTGNTATWDGGAIDNADGGNTGGGSVTVTASTFAGNTARVGGAIASGAWGGFGTATVTASTFTGNTTRIGGGNGLGGYGGAIAIGYAGNGSATVTASTFSGNTAEAAGGAIASGGNGGGGTMTVAGDLFNGSCTQGVGPCTDGGYNAGTDKSCFASTPQTGDMSGSAVGSDLQTGLTGNGGPTKTIKPTTGNPAIGLIPDPTTITLGSNQVALCPALDQRGYPSAASTACDAGAVQTSGWPPQVTGTHRPAAHAAEGYRLGVAGNTWKLYVTHPGTAKVSFTGKVSVPAGTLGHLSLINPTTGHQVSNTGKAITFTLPDQRIFSQPHDPLRGGRRRSEGNAAPNTRSHGPVRDCCQGHSQLPAQHDGPGTIGQQIATSGQFWATCQCLPSRSRRSILLPGTQRGRLRGARRNRLICAQPADSAPETRKSILDLR